MSQSARHAHRTTRAHRTMRADSARLAAEPAHHSAADLAALPTAISRTVDGEMHIPEALEAAIKKFWALAKKASKDGGFWVSSAGGTANVIAGVFSRRLGIEYTRVHDALDQALGKDWYEEMAWWQPWPIDTIPYDQNDGWWCKHDAKELAEAAIGADLRGANMAGAKLTIAQVAMTGPSIADLLPHPPRMDGC